MFQCKESPTKKMKMFKFEVKSLKRELEGMQLERGGGDGGSGTPPAPILKRGGVDASSSSGSSSPCDDISLNSLDEEKSSSGETPTTDLFISFINKKKNIYSSDPVPLSSPWTFWVDRTRRGVGVEEFEANLKCIYTVYTVNRFWNAYANIPAPPTLNHRSSLHMMRDGRKPVWEEEYNAAGGTFRMRCAKKDTEKVWRELLMAAIGEQLNEYVHGDDEVCGISVTIREREDIILIWNKLASEASQAEIFKCVHMLLPDTTFSSEFYKAHVKHAAFEGNKDPGDIREPRDIRENTRETVEKAE